MVEIVQKDGSWSFDGETVRIVPGAHRGVAALRRALGEVAVPLRALAGISYEPGRRSGRLRLRLRDGADPLLQVAAGRLEAASDPYRLTVESDRSGVAEYLAEQVRNTLLLEDVPGGPVDRYLLPGPAVPLCVAAGDGSVSFDGERIRLEWNWKTEESKSSGGPRTVLLADVTSVQWQPSSGLDNGHLRFRTGTGTAGEAVPAKHDPHAVELWGFRKDPVMALVGAAVAVRLPHPSAPRPVAARADTEAGPAPLPAPAAAFPSFSPAQVPGPAGDPATILREAHAAGPHADGRPAPGPAGTSGTNAVNSTKGPGGTDGTDGTDALLRRLRELGELHRDGILTAEEFATAKAAVLRQL